MTVARCHRLWQVEAVRDGRLSAQDASSFAVHIRDCRACSAEALRLERLAEQLRELEPAADQVSLYRGRQNLLKALDTSAQQATGSRTHQAVLAACAGLALTIAIGVMGLWLLRPHRVVDVAALGMRAHWTHVSMGKIESVELSGEGVFDVHIKRRPHDPRVAILLPDGYIEDIGTAFQVYLQERGTVRIAVSEGTIEFHRRDGGDIRLTAGQVWSAADSATAPSAQTADHPPQQRSGPAEVRPSTLSPTRQAPPLPAAPAKPLTLQSQQPSPKPGVTPSVTHAEDAAYMRVVSLLRAGRDFEAQLAALDYLKRYPTGFRHLEISQIVSSKPSAGPKE